MNDNSDPTRRYWTGAEERERHDHFYWVSSGKPVVIANWYSDYVPDSDTTDAVLLLDGNSYGWRWSYNGKSAGYYELCEADPADL
ncbi:unnamed protein product [Cyprideis torosa]|uniref:Uncharacterized protein n=1 Tax=Cyprideis torosa TaxID=163714 RepID=A0A7R8WTS8_9CRUS|nr:unnamed protein product [Cyprideis torosa]CAG0909848.1 unnamed protein product [Cyprideis torosa]